MDQVINLIIENNPKLHYIQLAELIKELSKDFCLSERAISDKTNISKTEINRLIQIANIPNEVKTASVFGVQKWVLIDASNFRPSIKNLIFEHIINGQIKTRRQLRNFLKIHGIKK
jgi:hypothetical protein